MAEFRLSANARRDLQQIRDGGVQEHGLAASDKLFNGFERVFQLLREHPEAGQERPEFDLGVRVLSHRPFRIFYRVQGDAVVVQRVMHQARDVRRALRAFQ